MKKYLQVAVFSLASLAISYSQSSSLEKDFNFLQDCTQINDVIGYDSYAGKIINSPYFSEHSYQPCALARFDHPTYKVFCIQETFYNLPVSKMLLTIDSDTLMFYGLLIDKSVTEAYAALKDHIAVSIFDPQKNNTYPQGVALLHKESENETMLFCRVPELTWDEK